MKRNLIIIILIVIGTIVMMVLADIITIAQKIAQATNVWWLEHAFYGIIAAVFLYFIIWPIIKVYRAPQIPNLSIDGMTEYRELYRFGRYLSANSGYIQDPQKRKEHVAKFRIELGRNTNIVKGTKDAIQKELDLRIEGDKEQGILGINGRIKEWAKTVFMVTAVSQNNKFDSLAVIVLNMKMIEDLILASGFRPSTMQMYKLYVNIILTSLVTYCTSAVFKGMEDVQPLDFLDNANPDDMVDNVADAAEETTFSDFPRKILNAISKLQIPGAIIGSALDGAANALMTLRIGYVTRHYIINGYENSMDGRRKVKREAMKSALRTMPAVLADSTSVIGEKAASFISKTYKFA